MARARMLLGLLGALLGAVVLAGCGSTVSGSMGIAAGQASADGLGIAISDVPAETGVGSTPTSAQPATAASAEAASAAAQTPATVTTSGGPQVVRSHAPVELGVILPSTSAGTAFGDLVGVALDTGDLTGMAAALTKWVNARGGLGGHPASTVFYHRCFNCNVPADDQNACTSLTGDHHVVAAIDNTQMSSQLALCLGKHGAAALGGGVAILDNAALREAASFFTPYGLSAETTFGTLIDRLNAMSWFPASEKLGLIVSSSDPVFAKMVPLVKARMKAIGRSFTAEAEIGTASSSDAASAVLRFKAAGIKRVVILGTGSGVELVLGPQEQTQGYHPKISVTSYDVLGTAVGLESAQFWEGAAGIGWMPPNDASSNRPAQNAAEKQCRGIYRSAGIALSSALAEAEGLAMCDGFFFAQRAYALAAGVSLAQLRSAVPTLAGAYVPASSFHSSFAAGIYAGADRVRDLRFNGACKCFDYASSAVAVTR